MTGDERREETQINHYMSSQCRRYHLSEYLDGSGVDYQEKDEKCDICKSITPIFLLLNRYINLYLGRNIEYHSISDKNQESREKSNENDLISSENDDFKDEIDEIPQGIYISSTIIDFNYYINNNIDEFVSIRESNI